MKYNCGEQEQESIHHLNISEQIRDKSIHKLFVNDLRIENYSLNTVTDLVQPGLTHAKMAEGEVTKTSETGVVKVLNIVFKEEISRRKNYLIYESKE